MTIQGKTDSYTGTLYVNACGYHVPPPYCPIGYNSIGYLVDEPKNLCFALTREDEVGGTIWSYGSGELDKIMSDGISMIGNTTNTTIAFNTTLSFRCNETITGDPEIDYEPNLTSNNSAVIILRHKSACGDRIRGPFGFVGDVKWLVIPVGFIFGCYLLVMGIKSIKVLLALLGGCTGFIMGSSVIGLFWKDGGNLETAIQFGVGLILAGIFGAVSFYTKKVGRFLGGLISGFILLLQVYYVIGYKMETKGHNVGRFH